MFANIIERVGKADNVQHLWEDECYPIQCNVNSYKTLCYHPVIINKAKDYRNSLTLPGAPVKYY